MWRSQFIYDVIAIVHEKVDETFHYDLSKDVYVAEVLKGGNPANRTVEPKGPTLALEGDPACMNPTFAPAGNKSATA
jgi:hypothetical protein